eukprot:scaffold2782_cov182-Amphora_coffeaeformis.AAC.4
MVGSSAVKRRVCLFGLSADPPTGTGGHVGIATKLSTLSEFDEIRVLPVYRHTYAVSLFPTSRQVTGKWKESDRVLQLLQGRFLVLNRVNGVMATTNTVPTELQDRVNKIKGARLVSIPSLGDVSSSRVREAVGKGDWEALDAQMLSPKVLAYIRNKGLYTSVQSS